MSSAYGTMSAPSNNFEFSPINSVLKDGSKVTIFEIGNHKPQVHLILNDLIEKGKTYPQEFVMSFQEFEQYFSRGFVCLDSNSVVLGAFYIKPNFPGRCSHICNGGFVVHSEHQGKGVGKVMGQAFKVLAPKLGFKAAMFNLVFKNNEPSVRLWKSLGFQIIGTLPNAGRLKGSDKLVDAFMFHINFENVGQS